ncbi:efflux RND transporter periplasmic adaptor subunit [Umezakia ovalisporum]|uniref:Cobalt transporter n=2 Tax=Umezakia ovalisporum TaxID=75695 RepID=A0AA43GYQ2_9CYAN|nr:cobalt transporter [Umezakia ovalisporum]MDH6057360.1 cobalt transporter [Umezakia ovalisporum FSS-43]MDH6063575.1 cobalt transporter [Umezakia ovalisporum FSS-62]MDH6065978.1 cobalt transporter [Umezakia ovalisporum APH033B]MDH6072500.1 cobalt transporter [Umezakia ovalisporum CobakiLakeA]MDH6075565.1 cobalt transporter [Umezakia ovalisporum CS-1034]
MKPLMLVSSILAASLTISAPTVVFAHVGHGDEFQATGGINRVKVNSQTDELLGIVVTPIASSAKSGSGVMIPVTALVDANGKQIVFVQYENFYEPVEVTTDATKGELIAVTKGLSVGEKLVTQGSLSLYAESRKTQTADNSASPSAIATPKTEAEHQQAHNQGTAHSHNTTQQASGRLPMGILAGVGGAVVLVGAAITFIARNRKHKGDF